MNESKDNFMQVIKTLKGWIWQKIS
jgi:hypothetical protein